MGYGARMNPVAQAIPVIGQPFTLEAVSVPMHARIRCNCGGTDALVEIVQSVAAPCPSCGRQFNVTYNPVEQKVNVQMLVPKVEPIS